MNASSVLRNSVYGLDVRPDVVPGLPARPKARTPFPGPGHANEAKATKRRTFVPVAYPEYSSSCHDEKDLASKDHIFDVELYTEPLTVGLQVFRMFTYYPYRDANWLVAMIFVVGSVSFSANAFLALLIALDPTTASDKVQLATSYTGLIGGSLFLIGSALAIPAVWNADSGTLLSTGILHKPALLGSQAWIWLPSAEHFGRFFWTVPFQAVIIQMLGSSILTISIPGGWPGVLDPDDMNGFLMFVASPLAAGGSLFFVANISLAIWSQDRWYKPKLASAAWQAAFWSTVGSANFAITGFAFLVGDMVTATLATFIGSMAFLVGAIFQLFDIMVFHPDDWAS